MTSAKYNGRKYITCNPPVDCKDRTECKKAGEIGHHQCGWCGEHNTPRHHCNHLLMRGGVHDYEPGEVMRPMYTEAMCRVCGEPKRHTTHR